MEKAKGRKELKENKDAYEMRKMVRDKIFLPKLIAKMKNFFPVELEDRLIGEKMRIREL